MHEIITIQIGEQSNYLGTHFWNAQESYFTYAGQEESPVDHDINFRPGIGADGSDTFTPRALVYDLKESFGTLRQSNALYALQNEESALTALRTGTALIQQPAIQQHPYQQHLDSNSSPPDLTPSGIRFWSDYNRVFYHPRSLVQLHSDPLTATLAPLHSWSAGAELFESEDREHDVLDRDFRHFAEECDQMQGIVMVAGIDDAWGGFAARYAERLRDEIGKGVLWVWGVGGTLDDEDRTRERSQARLANSIRSAHALSSQASVYVPLVTRPARTPSYVSLDYKSKWHTSALQAAALETLSLPSRLRSTTQNQSLLSDMEQLFTARSAHRKILQAELSVRNEAVQTNGIVNGVVNGVTTTSATQHRGTDVTMQDTDPTATALANTSLDISLFPPAPQPTPPPRTHLFSRLTMRRGIASDASRTVTSHDDPSAPLVHGYSSTLAFPALSSYPRIFGRNSGGGDDGLAMTASLSANSHISVWLRGVAEEARVVLGWEEREEMSSELRTWAEEYVEGWESGSDEDWDE